MNVLVIAPHPDDEVLGVGGTVHRFAAEGHSVVVAIVTKGWVPLFSEQQVAQVRGEAMEANKVLGVNEVRFLDLPAVRLGEIPVHELNRRFNELIGDVQPNYLFLPFKWDRHDDHGRVFDAAMVAARPAECRRCIQRIYCYETVSETHWTVPQQEPCFEANTWIDISGRHLQAKLSAMACYKSQVRSTPDARSIDAVRSLACWRGSVVNLHAAEAFQGVREIWH